MNPRYAVALKAAMRLNKTMIELGAAGRMSEPSARVTLDELRDSISEVTNFLDDVEARLAADGAVGWAAR